MRKGNACLQAKDFEQALAYYDRALQLQPNALVVQFARCLLLSELGGKDKVEQATKIAQESHSDRKEPLMFTHNYSLLFS